MSYSFRKYKFYPQLDQMDCGPACLAMISSYHGKDFGLQYLRENSFMSREGVSLLGITEAAHTIGFETTAVKLEIEDLKDEFLPCILHWNQNHFVVLYGISNNFFNGEKKFKIIDPSYGFVSVTEENFRKAWISDKNKGVALFMEPTDDFYLKVPPQEEKLSVRYLLNYLIPHKRQILKLFIFLLLGTITTLFLPILTQKLIDDGVGKKDMSVIFYILFAQLGFFLGNIIFNIFSNWIMLVVGTKINIHIISEFLKKLLRLPIKFFDTKLMGDFNQRIQDHERIESFLTSQSLLTVFSMITFSVFFGILWYYDFKILLVYLGLTSISIIWSLYWMKKRNILDYFRFQKRSENQESIYEIINGVSEMKLNQFEDFKRKEWEKIQQKLFEVNIRILRLDQLQLSGFEFINQLKNIIVTFLTAYLVVNDKMTLGSLLSVSYIIGQMNNPVNQLITFFRSLQDAKLSLMRLNEVQNHSEEESENFKSINILPSSKNQKTRGIIFENIFFQYEGPKSPYVLQNVNFHLPEGKITAIVGSSGGGKTSLLKLLLRFYDPTSGNIYINGDNILSLSPKSIRENCGVVMQDGYIFSDTIARNIAAEDGEINMDRLKHAVKIANLESFIAQLPLGYNTKIGASGNGISGGQKQRILIARAVYKDPQFIFFDEATSALDAKNEKIIHENLQLFFKGKTVLVIAHRLSTVKNADQIIVLKDGNVVETGNHHELVDQKEEYYNLVKNQLELGT
ncbi:peptidase domain-containing ABC transporter [Chryseobacterium sp. 18068]|uniref:peptidase domain-containing ABC transporter n=1 Tax=Chryseobacterium sp. 18068 TaxID=2681414 RepID=UPI001E5C1B0A|nr:peptidase domain-containing ABC transporter [Chryseobacterium sp. 18068]